MSGELPIVIVGGGVAGLATALAVAPLPVLLLCRNADGGDSASTLAQGGIAAAIGDGDDVAAHVADTLAAGAGHNDLVMVRWLCRNASGAVEWLTSLGVPFDRDSGGQLALGREGGHRAARIVHAGGDASGAAVVRSMHAQARAATHIDWRSDVDVDALLLRDGRVCGVRARDINGRQEEIQAAAVVLATGGMGALFARTSNPPGAIGSGLVLGMAAGAATRDLEFMQFHPTALDVADGHCLPLVTEALRGAGARLRRIDGSPLMDKLHAMGDLAPRDIVARQVWRALRDDGRVWLDTSGVEGDLASRFPTVHASCLAHGIDPRHAPIPVTPAAHFHMGGLSVDLEGRTTVRGLYAVGEVACNGVHGANRLASNSLLEGLLCGRRTGQHLSRLPTTPARGQHQWRQRGESLALPALVELRRSLWDAAGPVRVESTLQHALDGELLRNPTGWQARLAKQLIAAALGRRTSLGSHYRED
ncbi:L-aspartate oxidase [Dyella solisilvae]|uniref:L-aspartate oxidase n=1 Tax=Dyella solisilvae TaxID=1920168 RepID=A0A370K804_9GAMM|nr:L-aspartate oxidase [Dyella solisilvae]RDI98782.1 L-aspartate oxidase [Dyella solisilvae]